MLPTAATIKNFLTTQQRHTAPCDNMQHTAMMCIERAHHTWDEYFQLSGWGSGLFDMCEAAREAALGPRGPGKRSIHAGYFKNIKQTHFKLPYR